MEIKWVEENNPNFIVYSITKNEYKYEYYIDKCSNNMFSLGMIKFGDAPDIPKLDTLHHSIDEAKIRAEEHFLKYVVKS